MRGLGDEGGTRLVDVTGRPALNDSSGVFWRDAAPDEVSRIRALNARIGRGWQPLISQLFVVYVVGIPLYLAMRLFVRLRVVGRENVQRAGEKAILACRHFYEWDPAVTFFGLYWPWGLWDRRWAPHLLAGHFWTRTPVRRAVSWLLSNLALVRGEGEDQVAFERVSQLMAVPGPRIVGMFPTGPVGNGARVPPRPGVALLARRCPAVPVLPVTVIGLRRLRLRDVLLLRRPTVTIAVGEPFHAGDFEGRVAVERILDRIDRSWRDLETSVQKS